MTTCGVMICGFLHQPRAGWVSCYIIAAWSLVDGGFLNAGGTFFAIKGGDIRQSFITLQVGNR